MKKLPKTVYVFSEQDGDDEYLITHEALEDAANTRELGKSRLVGVYELKEQVTITAEVKTTIVPARTRQSK